MSALECVVKLIYKLHRKLFAVVPRHFGLGRWCRAGSHALTSRFAASNWKNLQVKLCVYVPLSRLSEKEAELCH